MESDSTFGFLEQFDKAQSNVSRWPEWARRSMVMASTFNRGISSKLELQQPTKKGRSSDTMTSKKRSTIKVTG